MINKIKKANEILTKERHSLISRTGYSNYISMFVTEGMLNKNQAEKALKSGIHIGHIAEHEEVHGTYEDYYDFTPIMNTERLEKYAEYNRISIDPAYGYKHLGEHKLDLKTITNFIDNL